VQERGCHLVVIESAATGCSASRLQQQQVTRPVAHDSQ
jgi:hypothetical protein